MRDMCSAALKGSPAERASAVRRLADFLGEREVRQTLTKVLANEKDRIVLVSALEAVARPSGAELFDDAKAHVWNPDLDIRKQAAVALAGIDRPKALDTLFKEALSGKETAVEAVRALGRLCILGEAERVADLLKSKNGDVRAVALAALMKIGNSQMSSHILPLLSDKHAAAREQAIQAAAFFRVKDSVPLLIEMLNQEETVEQAQRGLVDLTGRDFARDIEKWRLWWRATEVAFSPPPFAFLPAIPETTFFDHKISSVRCSLMLDFSESMGSGTGSSLEAQVKESHRWLTCLPPNAEANCVTFSRAADRFSPVAFEADSVGKRVFRTWLAKQSGDAYTATYDGFKLALDIPNLNVLILCGNGLPNFGDLPAGENSEIEDNVLEAVRKQIKKLNSQVRIYCVAFPFTKDAFEDKADPILPGVNIAKGRTFAQRAETFFRLLAADTGGKYQFVQTTQSKKAPK